MSANLRRSPRQRWVAIAFPHSLGQPLFHLHAASTGEIAYAIDYWTGAPAITVAG
jgi:3-deoxy-D-manno-octulosonic-acid transferase